jgi:hypothetical protein
MADDDSDPVIQRLRFGVLARQHRDAAGVEFAEADRRMGGYDGKLSKIERGMIAAKPGDIDFMVAEYGLSQQDADELHAIGQTARRRSAPKAVGIGSRRYISLERTASDIRMVFPEIPGLLQTEETAFAALSQSPTVPAGDALAQAQARAQRSERIVRSGGPEVGIVLGQEALHREVGGRKVLHDQLVRLRTIAELPNVSLRVIPWSAGAVPGLSCPFTLLYVNGGFIAYDESLTRRDYVSAIGTYLAAWDQASRAAVPEEESVVILEQRISDLSKRS